MVVIGQHTSNFTLYRFFILATMPWSNFLLHCITELIIDLVSSEQIDSAPAKLKAVVRKTDTIQVINWSAACKPSMASTIDPLSRLVMSLSNRRWIFIQVEKCSKLANNRITLNRTCLRRITKFMRFTRWAGLMVN